MGFAWIVLIAGAGIFNSTGSGIFPEGYPVLGSYHGFVSGIGSNCMFIAPFFFIDGSLSGSI